MQFISTIYTCGLPYYELRKVYLTGICYFEMEDSEKALNDYNFVVENGKNLPIVIESKE